MRLPLLFAVVLFAHASFVAAQKPGVSLVFDQPQIESMMLRYAVINKANPNLAGWRVQVIATTDRNKMEEVLAGFRVRYPDVYVDWVHQKPYYKVQAGAFTRKYEAWLLSQQLRVAYPSAFLMQDPAVRQLELVRN